MAKEITPLRDRLAQVMGIFRFADQSDLTDLDLTSNGIPAPRYREPVYDCAGVVRTKTETKPLVVTSTGFPDPVDTPAAPTATAVQDDSAPDPLEYYFLVFPVDANGKQGHPGVAKFLPSKDCSASLSFTAVPGAAKYWVAAARPTDGYVGAVNSKNAWELASAGTYALNFAALYYTDGYGRPRFGGYSTSFISGSTAVRIDFGNDSDVVGSRTNYLPFAHKDSLCVGSPSVVVDEAEGSNVPAGFAYYRVSAYNEVGETVPGPVLNAVFTSSPKISGGTGPTPTATPATDAGALAAGTYYYRVSVRTQAGECMPGVEVSAVLAATGQISLAWTSVDSAIGYVVYRGTTTGEETYLGVSTGPSFVDAGALTPTSLAPATQDASGLDSVAVKLDWEAVDGATGYRVWGRNTPTENVQLGTSETNSFTDTGQQRVNHTLPLKNGTGGAITALYQRLDFPEAGQIARVGVVFKGVLGKKYQIATARIDSGTSFAASQQFLATGDVQYVEADLDYNPAAQTDVLVGIRGVESGATLSLLDNAVPTDLAGLPVNKGMYATHDSPQSPTAYVYNHTGSPTQDNTEPTLVLTSWNLPLRIERRVALDVDPTPYGTLLGGNERRTSVLRNVQFDQPVRFVTPAVSVAGLAGQGKIDIEMSGDQGVTWQPLTPGARNPIDSVDQIMYRLSQPGSSRYTDFRTLPPNATLYSGTYTSESGYSIYAGYSGSANSAFAPGTEGGIRPNYSNWSEHNLLAFKGVGEDSDVTLDMDPVPHSSASEGCGIFSRADDVDNGYWLEYRADGQVILHKIVGGTKTALVTVTPDLVIRRRRLRLVTVGTHLMAWIDGCLIIDTTDASITIGSMAGAKGDGGEIYSLEVANTINVDVTPPNEIETFTAFYEN